MSDSETALAFHDLVTEILVDLAADEDEADDELTEAMAGVTDMILDSLNFEVTGEGVAQISLN